MFWLNKLAQKRCFFLHFAQMVTVVVDVAHVLFFNVIQKWCRFHCMCEECRQLPARFLMSCMCMRACVHASNQLILILEPIQTKLFYLSTPKRKKREKMAKEIAQLHTNIKISINATKANTFIFARFCIQFQFMFMWMK